MLPVERAQWSLLEAEWAAGKICLPVMVRLVTAETGARTAGRAALTAIWEARREAKTRVEAIVMVVRWLVGREEMGWDGKQVEELRKVWRRRAGERERREEKRNWGRKGRERERESGVHREPGGV